MSTKIPIGFTPGTFSIKNGDPTFASHPAWIDNYSTWLAAGYKPMIPNLIGEPMTSAVQHSLILPVPPFTRWLAVGLLCHGRGNVEVNLSDDTYDTKTGDLAFGTGLSGSHSWENAQWVWLQEPYQSVGGDGLVRALDVTLDNNFGQATLTLDITDESGTETLNVYQMMMYWIPPDSTETLPA
jgi:hypothetical protein